jgi:hypothetical protein
MVCVEIKIALLGALFSSEDQMSFYGIGQEIYLSQLIRKQM